MSPIYKTTHSKILTVLKKRCNNHVSNNSQDIWSSTFINRSMEFVTYPLWWWVWHKVVDMKLLGRMYILYGWDRWNGIAYAINWKWNKHIYKICL